MLSHLGLNLDVFCVHSGFPYALFFNLALQGYEFPKRLIDGSGDLRTNLDNAVTLMSILWKELYGIRRCSRCRLLEVSFNQNTLHS